MLKQSGDLVILHGRNQGVKGGGSLSKKIDKDYSNWMGIKKFLEQFVHEILTCDSLFFLYVHLKILV